MSDYTEHLTLEVMFLPNGIGSGWQSLGNVTELRSDNEFTIEQTTRTKKGFKVSAEAQVNDARFAWLIDTNESTPTNEVIQRLSTIETTTQDAADDAETTIANVRQGQYYPIGRLDVSNVTVDGYLPFDDYVVDDGDGLIYIVPGGGIANGSTLSVTYDCPAMTLQQQQHNDSVVHQGSFQLYYYGQKREVFRIEEFTGVIICVNFSAQTGEFGQRSFVIVAQTDPIAMNQVDYRVPSRVCVPGDIVEDWEDYALGTITAPDGGCGFLGAGVAQSNYSAPVATEDYEDEPLGTITTTTGGTGFDGTGLITANSV